MDYTTAQTAEPRFVVFRDGLGSRRRLDPGGDPIEALCFRRELSALPLFEFSIAERIKALTLFRHSTFARVRAAERLNDRDRTLALMSTAVPGVRLSELLATATRGDVVLDLPAALALVSQLVPAIAALHEQGDQLAHGCLGLERLIVGPDGTLAIAEHILGSALQRCGYTHERYWSELRIATPPSAGLPALDQRADVMQMAVAALELCVGRPLRDDEYQAGIAETLASAWVTMQNGDKVPVPAALRSWLRRALQLEPRSAVTSAAAARDELDAALKSAGCVPSLPALKRFLDRCAIVQDTASPDVPAAPARAMPALALPIETAADTGAEESAAIVAEEETLESPARSGLLRRAAAAVFVVVVGATGIGAAVAHRYSSAPLPPRTGTLTITSDPAGLEAVVDGRTQGTTPATLTLNPGPHRLELRSADETRSFPITITAGAQLSQYIEMSPRASTTGNLEVRSDPPGAPVTVDDVPRGMSPVTVGSLPAGDHSVSVSSANGQPTKQTVRIDPGATASLVVRLAAPIAGPASGWINVSAPANVQLYEDGRLLGTSDVDRIMLAAGSHQLDVVNDALGYRGTQTVQVTAGKVSSMKVAFPKGTVALNAVPWAEVWIDGEKIGETPIGNLPIAIGSHDIVFRHPDFGEQHRTLVVTLTSPARISMNMRTP